MIELAGDKLRAREEAARAGLPVLPGRRWRQPPTRARSPSEIGYPLLVKAAGGGGGRGIKLARDDDELDALLGLARSEAGAAFGDERVYLERFIAAARHVEVQIAADEHGAVVHLGERDCSVQRRYQKVIEEAPAPAPRRRAARRADAPRRSRSRGRSATATWAPSSSSLDADTGEFFFLEINCRIQVEHPVTEAVTGRDLVALQLQIADGEPLGFAQDDVALRRPRDRVPAERRGRGARLHAQPRDAVAVLGAGAAGPARRHALLRRAPRSRRTTTRCWPS